MKPLKQILFALCLLTLTFSFYSCDKEKVMDEAQAIEEVDKNGVRVTEAFFLDGTRVAPGTFDYEDPTLEMIVIGRQLSPTESVLEYNAYTTLQGLYDFGRQNNIPIEAEDQIEQQLADYAVSSGAIDEYDRTGNVPAHFTAFEERLLGPANKNDAITAFMFNSCGGGGVLPGKHYPALCCGWNNSISQVEIIGVIGSVRLYDRSFYRRRLIRFWSLGFNRVCLSWRFPWTNNRTSSYFVI